MVSTLACPAPINHAPKNDIEAFTKEIVKEKFVASIEVWICRFLNVTSCEDTINIACTVINLWDRVTLKPPWYLWTYHALAVMYDMRDVDGFRYQSKSDWDPINNDQPFHTLIEHVPFVLDHFPLDVQSKFCVYSTSETVSADTSVLNLHFNYFNFVKKTLDRSLKHLRQSLIAC